MRNRNNSRILAACLVAALLILGLSTFSKERSEIDPRYQWDLSDLYPDRDAWMEAKADLEKRIPVLAGYKGKLGESAGTFYTALSTGSDVVKDFSKLYSYASMNYDQDTRVSESDELRQMARRLAVDFSAATSFMSPEILELGPEKVNAFVAEDPRLKDYVPYLDDILRMKPYTLDPKSENLLAQAGNLAGASRDLYGIFTNADMPYPEVTLSDGETVRLDAASYTKYRAVPNREDREKVFKAFWTTYNEYRRTFGTSLGGHMKTHVFNKDVRGFDSCLQASLSNYNIPVEVYEQLISDVHSNLPTLHRYLKLFQRMLEVEDLKYSDLYAAVIKDVEMDFTPDDAMKTCLAAFKPLGPKYVSTLGDGFDSRWIDFYPTTGKRSGAYSNGSCYDVHPYELLNFMGGYDDVSTLAHEAGHSMHSYLSNKNQPYVTADYSIFVAEVASTLNEAFLMDHMLEKYTDDDIRLFLLGQRLDGYRQTLFRQTLFAEFEWRIHQMAEEGTPLTGDSMNELYLGLLKKYYGHDEGVCTIDELYAVEWAYIPHFYYNFYVYQYATSLTASTSIFNRIKAEMAKGDNKTRDAYVKMLSSGSTKYPIDLLKGVGCDMTTSEPFNTSMMQMNKIMDEIEAILDKKGAK